MIRATSQRTGQAIAAATLLLAVLTTAAGCGQKHYTDYSAFLQEPRPLVSSSTYRIMPPDVIQIDAKHVREIHGHREQVRADGRLTFPLLGNVYVAGKTPEEISQELETMSRLYYEDAEVTLRVVSYRSQKIFVFGEVGIAGAYPYTGANTVLAMMASAQPTRLANTSRIHIHRPDRNGELTRHMTIDLDKMVRRGDMSLNAVLEEGDIIYVPPTGFASVGLALQQLLLPIQPAAAVVSGPADIYDNSQQRPYISNDNASSQ